MATSLHRLLAVLALGGLLTACGGGATGTRTADTDTGVVDRSLAAADPAATTIGAAPGRRLTGDALDDPQGVLAQRTVYFAYDSSDLRAEDRPIVEAHARYLTAHPDVTITLEGHTDERGSREYNIGLGERRAQSVRNLITLLGASGQQVRVVSYGKERPAAEGHDESAWRWNRRAELIYRTR